MLDYFYSPDIQRLLVSDSAMASFLLSGTAGFRVK
jgi:hypothetical protein